jgi:hypothetical protein
MTAVLIDVDSDEQVHLGLGQGLEAIEETDIEKERGTEGRKESRKEADRERGLKSSSCRPGIAFARD